MNTKLFNQLYADDYNKVLAKIRHLLPKASSEEVEDIAESAWLVLLERMNEPNGNPIIEDYEKFIFGVAKNKVHEYIKEHTEEPLHPDDLAQLNIIETEDNKEEAMIHSEESEMLNYCVCKMPDKYRIPFELHFLKGMRARKIAAMLHKSPDDIRHSIGYAKKLFLRCYSGLL